MRILRRRKTRRQRLARRLQDASSVLSLSQRRPSTLEKQDSVGLSLAGGLLLGLLVGIIVALVLALGTEHRTEPQVRNTGIELLPPQDERDLEEERSSAVG